MRRARADRAGVAEPEQLREVDRVERAGADGDAVPASASATCAGVRPATVNSTVGVRSVGAPRSVTPSMAPRPPTSAAASAASCSVIAAQPVSRT